MIIKHSLVVLMFCVFAQCEVRQLRSFLLLDMSISGGPLLQGAVNKQETDLIASVNAMEPVDAACDQKGRDFRQRCATCTTEKCDERRASCPSFPWYILPAAPNFFKSTGISAAEEVRKEYSGFVSGISNVVRVMGKEIREMLGHGAAVADRVGQEFENKIQTALDISKSAGRTVVNFKEGSADTLKSAANTVRNAVLNGQVFNIGRKINNIKEDVEEGVKKAAETVKNVVSSIFGKRRLSIGYFEEMMSARVTRSEAVGSPPSCIELLINPDACEYYAQQAICPTCLLIKERDCPGWKNANENVQREQADARWLDDRKQNNEFAIIKLAYDTNDYDRDTGTYRNTDVTVSLFGRQYQFIVPEPLDLIEADADSAGRIITYAIAAAKLAKVRGLA